MRGGSNKGQGKITSFYKVKHQEVLPRHFSGGSVVKNLPPSVGDAGSTPGKGAKIPLGKKTKT